MRRTHKIEELWNFLLVHYPHHANAIMDMRYAEGLRYLIDKEHLVVDFPMGECDLIDDGIESVHRQLIAKLGASNEPNWPH